MFDWVLNTPLYLLSNDVFFAYTLLLYIATGEVGR